MKFKKIFLLLAAFLPFQINALSYAGCSYEDVANLKSLVTNINISYSYHMNEVPYFDITLNNITSDMYFIDSASGKQYNYSDTNNGEITIYNYKSLKEKGSYYFYSAKQECYGVKLGSKYYKFPVYNNYYGSELCNGIEEFKLCQKWENVNYSYSEMEAKIEEYKNSNIEENIEDNIQYSENKIIDVVNFYIKYYYYFLIVIIVICFTVALVLNKKEKNKLKL